MAGGQVVGRNLGRNRCFQIHHEQIIIKDDGIGITSTNDNNKGIGLMNIESRVNGLNGHFYVQSNNKKGISFHLIFRLNYII